MAEIEPLEVDDSFWVFPQLMDDMLRSCGVPAHILQGQSQSIPRRPLTDIYLSSAVMNDLRNWAKEDNNEGKPTAPAEVNGLDHGQ